MNVPITRKLLADWGGPRVLRDAESLVDRGLVQEAVYEPPHVRGVVLWSNRPLRTSMRVLPDGSVESECPCWANTERGIVCPHVVAVALSLVMRQTDPNRDLKYQEELRRARRMETVDEGGYIARAHDGTPGAVSASIRIALAGGWEQAAAQGRIPIIAEAEYRGHTRPLDEVPRDVALRLSREDEALLFVLEDICAGPARGSMDMGIRDFLNVLRLKSGGSLRAQNGGDLAVNKAPVTTYLRMDLHPESGELQLAPHTELPFMPPGGQPMYLVSGRAGWAFGAGHFWPLENLLPEPYHGLYMGPITVPRANVLRFFRDELPVLSAHARVESEISPDLFSVEPATPSFHLDIRGSPASLSATLFAQYDGYVLVAGKPDPREHFGIADPNDPLRYTVRNLPAEREALQTASRAGFTGEFGDALASIVDNRNVLNFLGGHLPALRRLGWSVTLEGRVQPYFEALDFVAPVVQVADATSGGWFDVGFGFEAGPGSSLSPADVQLALRRGESYIERNGRTSLIDADAVESVMGVFSDCATSEADLPGHFRMSGVYAPFVRASLAAIDGVDIEETPAWRERALRQNREAELKPVALSDQLQATLRPYQHHGVSWLRFLEECGFSGLLADEMGLGKTLETLAWLQMERFAPEARGKPALIVCPTSIVENWAEECAKFVPRMRVAQVVGQDRERKWAETSACDIAVTSYAILRRDIDTMCALQFSVVVLDEAQHIKNRSTQNAASAKRLKTFHRLVLTGTPVENGVADLWSIMDFLMPGYLGAPDKFRGAYELPIARGGPDAECAHARLRRKLHPFLLRRLKTDVAKDLPPKIEKIASCTLTEDQKTVYREVLEASRRRIRDMVASQGFNRCRMEILGTLMRLRQICCHLELLKLPNLKPDAPSAKTELFFELLDEALDSGHRILVFSQFVSMLTILRREMESRGLTYCYLDGSTKDRMKIVHQFNTSREIPVFLISLKAGGTGLNLTGADMVIHFDPWWNPAVENQATDRAYRIGQKRTVYSVKLITRGTVEEKVLALQERKKSIINATIESDEQVMTSLSWEDIQNLLDL